MSGVKINPKELFLGIFSGAAGVAALVLWRAALPKILSGEITYGGLTYAIATLVLGSCLFAGASLFARNQWVVHGQAAAFGITPIFLAELGGNSIALILMPLFFSLFAAYRMQNETRYSCGFNSLKNMRAGLPYFFTAFAFAVSIFYISGLKPDEVASLILPRPAFNLTIRLLREPLRSFTGITTLDADKTVDDMLLLTLEGELQKQKLNIGRMPRSEIEKLLAAERREISKRYGIRITGKEKITDVFYKTVSDRIEDFARPYKSYLPYISALALFFAFKAFTWPLYIVSVLITAGLIRILIKSKMLKKEVEEIKVERIIIA